MSSFVEDMSLSDIQLSDDEILSEQARLTEDFGFPYKNKYGDAFYFLGIPHTSGASEAVVRVDGNGNPYSTFGPASTDTDVTVLPGSVYLVKVYGKSGEVEVLDEVFFSHEDNARVAEILLDEEALPEDSDYYEEAYMEKYGEYPDSDVAYSYVEFEGDASRKYGVSDSVGSDFEADFLEGAARDLRKESDEELLASLESDHSPENLSRVAWILHKQGRTSLKDGGREVLAIANGPDYDKPLDYSYNQRAWTHVVDCDGVTRMSDIGSSVPGRYPANRRSSGRQK